MNFATNVAFNFVRHANETDRDSARSRPKLARIPAGYSDLYGIVSQVGAGAAPSVGESAQNFGNRWLRVELVGEGGRGRKFERGISQYPTIGDLAHVVTESDLAAIYAPGENRSYVSIGQVASAESIPAYLDLNKLVTRHSALVGSTGAGKSTTVASLLNSLAEPASFPGTRIVLLDQGRSFIRYPWIIYAPGIAVFLLVTAIPSLRRRDGREEDANTCRGIRGHPPRRLSGGTTVNLSKLSSTLLKHLTHCWANEKGSSHQLYTGMMQDKGSSLISRLRICAQAYWPSTK